MNRRWPALACSLALAQALVLWAPSAHSFCGFYVARGDAKLFNKASKVVLVRDDDRTVLTMSADFKGDPKEFALVVPVPNVLKRGQIHVGEQAAVEHLDAYTAPRLVEYFDGDPCAVAEDRASGLFRMALPSAPAPRNEAARAKALGVTIEARYSVGEYDILILSAKESAGLQAWLVENGYRVPPAASRVLNAYLRQGMKFFVAKVNLKEQARLGYTTLRPLQMAYESPKFMLPLRLGMVNADGPQDLFVFALTRNGRVETTNYRTVKLPSDADVPEFVKDEFADFYRDMFTRSVRRENGSAVFLEYAWDMAWCDPCAADPMSRDELRGLGVFWLDPPADDGSTPGGAPRWSPPPSGGAQAQNVFVPRLHVRYDAAHFPEDLALQETGDRSNFQGRFVLHHPWKGESDCPAAASYRKELRRRQAREAETLASLTGWDLDRIYRKMQLPGEGIEPTEGSSWWDKMWKGGSR